MEKDFEKKIFLIRDGQSSRQRFSDALDPFYVKIDDRDIGDMLLFAEKYAEKINYYDHLTGNLSGDWSDFFKISADELLNKFSDIKIDGIFSLCREYGVLKPHLGLYLAFLMLFRYAQENINNITGRHLEFYFKEVLGLKKKVATPDRVHVIFKLKKGIEEFLIKKGTLLKGGKDSKGVEMYYATSDDIVINKALIASLKSLYVDPVKKRLHVAAISNSADGMGKNLDPLSPGWNAFGHNNLPEAEIGFALASQILNMKEGTREIKVTLECSASGGEIKGDIKNIVFDVYITGEKGWIHTEKTVPEYISGQSPQLKFSVVLKDTDGPIVNYNQSVHGGNYGTDMPVLKVMPASENSYQNLRDVVLKSIRIDTKVKGIKNLDISNDYGNIDPTKPFLPFGPAPVVGSQFCVGCRETTSETLTDLTINIEWKIADKDISVYYSNYTGISVNNEYFKAVLITDKGSDIVSLFDSKDASRCVITIQRTPSGISISNMEKEISRLKKMDNRWAKNELKKMSLLGRSVGGVYEGGKSTDLSIENKIKDGYIIFRSQTDFLHKYYRRLYTANIATFARSGGTLILPGEPYTPEIQSITFDYTASCRETDLTSTERPQFLSDSIEFYHIGAFGQMREHAFLRKEFKAVERGIYLLPQYNNEGEFYIGINDVKPPQDLSILFQVAEGTANPESERTGLRWYMLSDNYWREFQDNEILSDSTNGLLTSGIIRFRIPEDVTDQNTIMSSGLFWIKAAISRQSDSVCNLIDVRANAVAALSVSMDTEQGHPGGRLDAGRINGILHQPAAIKDVLQPYTSFGGRPAEDDRTFYTRASERLRHKDRAVSIWDYERIVLENFPSIYKIKCLGHVLPSSGSSIVMAPGHVTAVVIPDIKGLSATNRIKPMVDINTREGIKKFLKKKTCIFVEVHVVSPVYEEIRLDFKVRFVTGYSPGYYRDVLNNDIKKYLCPWAYEEGVDISFGGEIHKSVILAFIEKRPYVDFVTDIMMHQVIGGVAMPDTDAVKATTPVSVIVSSHEHNITVL